MRDRPGGQTCGGLLGRGCPDEHSCKYAPEAQCGAADATGVCTPIPENCTFEFAPVCGCDDKTYPNACAAAVAGVAVATAEACC